MTDHFEAGGMTVTRITDLPRFALALDFLFPGADAGMLAPHRALLAGDHVDFDTAEVLLGVHSLLVRRDGLVILIDTCVGECKPRPRRADWHNRKASGYLEALAREGLRPEDVDIVLCTHLHADHVGWNTRLVDGRWVPTFPKARYICGAAEFAHWQAQEAAAPGAANHGAWADSVAPLLEAGCLERLSPGEAAIEGLVIRDLAGHSPGQIGLEITCAEGGAVFCGDAIHSPVQMLLPDWTSRFCHDPAQAVATRRALLSRAADLGLMLFPGHFRGALGARVTRADEGFVPDWL
ncbi:MBL fold metallo-hydrolase [Frigidibacter sp. MR17.24]|uniref:MBL fold metallo-hydrolase n=1 Tax=Frigidibacter sp. MR17.24 TaxID=3127345 RepID=UPI0030130DEC